MDVDGVLRATGPFGAFQVRVVSLCFLAVVFPCMSVLLDVFVNFTPAYRCRIPECDVSTSSYNAAYVNFTTPYVASSGTWEKCTRFRYEPNLTTTPTTVSFATSDGKLAGSGGSCSAGQFNRDIETDCDSGFVYDTEVFSSSSVMEFELTCSHSSTLAVLNFMYMCGIFVGSAIIGGVGDRFGRKIGLMTAVFLVVAGGIGCASSASVAMLMVMRFITGLGGNGVFQCAFIIAVEYVVPEHRRLVGILINVPYAMGGVALAVVAYFVRDSWRWLTICSTLPTALLFSYYWLIPESSRWLLGMNRTEEARKVLQHIANVNKKPLPEHLLGKQAVPPKKLSLHNDVLANSTADDPHTAQVKHTFLDLLRMPNMRKRTLISFFIWMTVTLVYYGLSQTSVSLGGNTFVNFALSMLVEIPASIFVSVVLDRLGRKGTLAFTLTLAGVACVTVGLLDDGLETLVVCLSLAGKFGVGAAFGIVYVYASEIFPTDYRSIGIGACSMCARIGGIMAPIAVSLSRHYWPPLAFLLFGAASLVSGLLTLLLPETTGCVLPTSIEDSEAFGCEQHWYYFHFMAPKTKVKTHVRVTFIPANTIGTLTDQGVVRDSSPASNFC